MKRHFLCSAIIGIAAVAAQQPGFAQAMPEQIDGYFASSGTTFAKAGGTICGFRSGGHYEIFRRAKPAPSLKITTVSTYKYIGACPVPRAFFDFEKTGYFSWGDGSFCGFANGQVWQEYRERYNAPIVGKIPTKPDFMSYKGACPNPS
jgi:hypothetical protein